MARARSKQLKAAREALARSLYRLDRVDARCAPEHRDKARAAHLVEVADFARELCELVLTDADRSELRGFVGMAVTRAAIADRPPVPMHWQHGHLMPVPGLSEEAPGAESMTLPADVRRAVAVEVAAVKRRTGISSREARRRSEQAEHDRAQTRWNEREASRAAAATRRQERAAAIRAGNLWQCQRCSVELGAPAEDHYPIAGVRCPAGASEFVRLGADQAEAVDQLADATGTDVPIKCAACFRRPPLPGRLCCAECDPAERDRERESTPPGEHSEAVAVPDDNGSTAAVVVQTLDAHAVRDAAGNLVGFVGTHARTRRHRANVNPHRIALVGCSKSKRADPSPARDLYTGQLFKAARTDIESRRDEDAGNERIALWYVLSAEYDLVPPSEVIEPYDRTLQGMRPRNRERWAQRVSARLEEITRPGTVVELHACGKLYSEHLTPLLEARGIVVVDFGGGKAIGIRKQLYSQRRKARGYQAAGLTCAATSGATRCEIGEHGPECNHRAGMMTWSAAG